MSRLPRIAIGALQPAPDCRLITWALLNLMRRDGTHVQHFLSQACFEAVDGATPAAGVTSRYLDSWLMTPEVCREAFVHGCRCSDLAVVQESESTEGKSALGGRLEVLCDWLRLPRLAVLDAASLGRCQLPRRPAADALLLDNVSSPAAFRHWSTILEPLWGLPVLGGLEVLPTMRNEMRRLTPGGSPGVDFCNELGRRFAAFTSPEKLRALADRAGFPHVEPCWYRPPAAASKLRVAVAYDEAFWCYFPDTLDLLELWGADVVEFSPLSDEQLPEKTDLVYFGCGHPERHAEQLAANHCMTLALRKYICGGGRVYAEGGGLAYLCQHLDTPDGQQLPMVGAFSAAARLGPEFPPAAPVQRKLKIPTWLGDSGSIVRGYLNSYWSLEPIGELANCVYEPTPEFNVVTHRNGLGSRIHMNFAAQPKVFACLLEPRVGRSPADVKS